MSEVLLHDVTVKSAAEIAADLTMLLTEAKHGGPGAHRTTGTVHGRGGVAGDMARYGAFGGGEYDEETEWSGERQVRSAGGFRFTNATGRQAGIVSRDNVVLGTWSRVPMRDGGGFEITAGGRAGTDKPRVTVRGASLLEAAVALEEAWESGEEKHGDHDQSSHGNWSREVLSSMADAAVSDPSIPFEGFSVEGVTGIPAADRDVAKRAFAASNAVLPAQFQWDGDGNRSPNPAYTEALNTHFAPVPFGLMPEFRDKVRSAQVDVSRQGVEKYLGMLETDMPEPPMVAWDEQTDTYVVGDGYHRMAAMLGAGMTLFEVMVPRESPWAQAMGVKHMGPGPHPNGTPQSIHAGRLGVPVDTETFMAAFEATMRGSEFEAFVTWYDKAEVDGMKRFMAPDGKSGVMVKDHGDGRIEATALFSTPDADHRSGRRLLREMMNHEGVNYAECFGPRLRGMYELLGLETHSEYPFNREYAPPAWNYDLHDPDEFPYFVLTDGDPDVEAAATAAWS